NTSLPQPLSILDQLPVLRLGIDVESGTRAVDDFHFSPMSMENRARAPVTFQLVQFAKELPAEKGGYTHDTTIRASNDCGSLFESRIHFSQGIDVDTGLITQHQKCSIRLLGHSSKGRAQ